MLEIVDIKTKEKKEFKNSSELKDFLKMQNPTFLNQYKDEIKNKYKDLVIDGIGDSIRIFKK